MNIKLMLNSKNLLITRKNLLIVASILILLAMTIISYFIYSPQTTESSLQLSNIVLEVDTDKIAIEEFLPYLKVAIVNSNPNVGKYGKNKGNAISISTDSAIKYNALDSFLKTYVQVRKAKYYGQMLSQNDIIDAEREGLEERILIPFDNYAKTYYQSRKLATKVEEKVMEDKRKVISEEALKSYYDENKNYFFVEPLKFKVNQILISYPQSDKSISSVEKEKVKLKAQETFNMIKNGKSFDDIAKQYSDDETTKNNSGDTELQEISYFNSSIGEVLPDIKIGELKIVEAPNGYYVFKLIEKQNSRVIPLEEIKDRVADSLIESQTNNIYSDTVDKWVSEAKIIKYYDVINSIDISKLR